MALPINALPIITIPTHYVESGDLENFIGEVYGKEFNVALDQEVGNDSAATFLVSSISVKNLNSRDAERFNDFMESPQGESYLLAGKLLNDLCFKEMIPAGKYVVNVCW